MAIKHVLAPAFSLARDESALRVAAGVAQRFDARMTALLVSVQPGETVAQAMLSDSKAASKTLGAAAALERSKIAEWLRQSSASFELRDALSGAAMADVRSIAGCTDLVVAARGDAEDGVRQELIEALLFQSGRPLLLIPDGWRGDDVGQRVVVGWDGGREAARAVSDALPLLGAAADVKLVTVDARLIAESETPGAEICAQLLRHGARAHVRNLDAMGRTIARALLDEAHAMDADMLVIGGARHTRAGGFVLGGVTSAMLSAAPMPVLLSN
jgi:nucleotide-binding universal stress UspA family protein